MAWFRICCMLILFGSIPFGTFGQDLTQESLKLFQEGQYDQAAAIYEKMLLEGDPSPDLYFNLGTCYFQGGRIGEARLAMEKGLRLNPGHKQLLHQLALVKSKIDPQIEALPSFLLFRWFAALRNQWPSSRWGILLLVFTWLFSILFFLHRAGRWSTSAGLKYSLITLAAFTAILFFSRKHEELKHYGILVEGGPLRIAPDLSSQVLLPLGAGSKSEVVDSLGAWYKVILENNDQGWIEKSSLRRVQ